MARAEGTRTGRALLTDQLISCVAVEGGRASGVLEVEPGERGEGLGRGPWRAGASAGDPAQLDMLGGERKSIPLLP